MLHSYFQPDFSTIISDFEMSDEDPHNSNHRREKKSKLFRPHEITDGKLGPTRLSGWLNHSVSINLKFRFIGGLRLECPIWS